MCRSKKHRYLSGRAPLGWEPADHRQTPRTATPADLDYCGELNSLVLLSRDAVLGVRCLVVEVKIPGCGAAQLSLALGATLNIYCRWYRQVLVRILTRPYIAQAQVSFL
jgi:hypothetical protein